MPAMPRCRSSYSVAAFIGTGHKDLPSATLKHVHAVRYDSAAVPPFSHMHEAAAIVAQGAVQATNQYVTKVDCDGDLAEQFDGEQGAFSSAEEDNDDEDGRDDAMEGCSDADSVLGQAPPRGGAVAMGTPSGVRVEDIDDDDDADTVSETSLSGRLAPEVPVRGDTAASRGDGDGPSVGDSLPEEEERAQ